ncbi:class B sortase [Eubacteriales bacterium OttesenSCG-928-K08]|nr:class B sortase [Eubacteriales bacterium OttesenSCG-928-K08]
MKKFTAMLLVVLMLLFAVACGRPVESDDLTLPPDDNNTPDTGDAVTPTPEVTPTAIVTATPDQVDPTTTPTTIPDDQAMTPPPVSSPTSKPANSTPTPTPAATTDAGVKKTPTDLSSAFKLNDDTVGWIKISNTNINYPIVYDDGHTKSGGSWYYADHNFYKEKDNAGAVHSYYDRLTRNNVITAHNMRKSGTMFHDLHKVQESFDLTKSSNRTITVDWYGYTKWEIFAVYETKDDEPASTLKYNTQHLAKASESTIKEWINYQISRSEKNLGVSVSSNDILMTLVTCGDEHDYPTAQSRLYIFLKTTAKSNK